MEFLKDNFQIIQFAMSAIISIAIFILVLVFVKRKDHEILKAQVQKIQDTYSTDKAHIALATQVTTIETKLKSIPSSEDRHSLEKEVSELKGSVDGMKDLLKNINNHVNMLVENEIKG
ncbi:DUF2730 family protein [Cognaticolwellia mytili]|uniref:DUF2730 family protein n=1 Tax=Cognaticolwellia mytili TaxID=1888913 RepID=UPI000A1732D2|nr:DUF2730 family protein [Cognaticolwellia mytili]